MGSCVEPNNQLGRIITGQNSTDCVSSGDEVRGVVPLPFGYEAVGRLAALRDATFGGETLPEESAEFIREAREARSNP